MGLWLLIVVSVAFSPTDGYHKTYSFERLDSEAQCNQVKAFVEADALESRSKTFPQCVYIGTDPKILAAERAKTARGE